MPSTNKRSLILIGVVVAILGLLALVTLSLLRLSHNKNSPGNSNTAFDPYSKETVSSPPGKTPEVNNGSSAEPLILGLSSFSNYGVSEYQLNDFKYALSQYAKTRSPAASQISVVVETIKKSPHDPNSPNPIDTITFDIVADKNDRFSARLDYYDLTAIHLYIYEASTTKVVYDSGAVDLSAQ